MTAPTGTTVTRQQAVDQVRDWIKAGLPDGDLQILGDTLSLQVADEHAVRGWAAAMDVRLASHGDMCGLVPTPRPKALGGAWVLDVWCRISTGALDPTIRIEVLR